MSSGSPSLWPLLWFVVVVALIPVSLWLLKRSPLGARLGATPADAPASMRAVSTLSLGQGQRLVTVEVGQGEDRRWLVLGVTAQQISTLHTLTPPAVDAGATAAALPAPGFASLLAGLRRDGGATPPGAAR